MRNVSTMLRAALSTLLLCCLLSGCIASSVSTLKSDSFSENRYKSILFGKIRFISKDGSLGTLYADYAKVVNLRKVDEKEVSYMACIDASLKPWQGSYAHQFEVPFYGEAVPGLYDLRSVSLGYGCSNMENSKIVAAFAEFGSQFENSKFVYSVPPSKLIYLGTLEVEVLSTSFDSGGASRDTITGKQIVGTYTSKYRTRIINEQEKDLQEFKRNYPSLYEKYKDNVISAFWTPGAGSKSPKTK